MMSRKEAEKLLGGKKKRRPAAKKVMPGKETTVYLMEKSKPKKAEVESNPKVYWECAFYTNLNLSWQAVLNIAKEERELRDPESVVVKAHNHNYGESCKKTCRVL